MYGTKELNEKRLRFTKEHKGKYFLYENNKDALYRVKNVICDMRHKTLKLVFVEVAQKSKYNSVFGEYKELIDGNNLYFISENKFKNDCKEVTASDGFKYACAVN